MKGFFDPNFLLSYNKEYGIVLDTNVLSSMYANEDYYSYILDIFHDRPLFIDPIVKMEFTRGSYSTSDFEEKTEFLEYERFTLMADHQEIFRQVYKNAFNIARISAHNGNPSLPLGDLFIISRIMLYEHILFLTLDKGDFSTVLFDRSSVLSLEKPNSKGKLILEHLTLLQFSTVKYNYCLSRLPKKS